MLMSIKPFVKAPVVDEFISKAFPVPLIPFAVRLRTEAVAPVVNEEDRSTKFPVRAVVPV